MTFKEKLRNSGKRDAIKTANVLDNIRAESLGTFHAEGHYRTNETPGGYGVPAEGRSVLCKLYKVYDYNDPKTTGRKHSEAPGARELYDGTQVSFAVVPQVYRGRDPRLAAKPYEFVDGADETDYKDASDPDLVVASRDYGPDVATIAQSELLREEAVYRENYFVERKDGALKPPNSVYFENLTRNVLRDYMPEELAQAEAANLEQ